MAAPALRSFVSRHTLRRTFITSLPRLATSPSPPEPVPSAITASPSSPGGFSNSPKVEAIVDQISTLTLLEAADLVQALKTRLNIADVPMVAAAAPAAAPAAAAAAAPTDAPEAAAAAEKPKEKQAFKVTLKSIDAAQKAKAIKEVKAAISGMNLVEAKKFVESAPQVIKESMPKEEAEKLLKAFEAVGAVVVLE